MSRPQLRVRVNLAAIAHNTRTLAGRLGPTTRLMAVVKADGYGHGAVAVAKTMADYGAEAFGVATIAEALQLRDAGITEPILAWLWQTGDDLSDAAAAGIELAVPSPEHLQALVTSGLGLDVCLKVETGMHRSGLDESQWADAFALAAANPQLRVTGLMSHLACADEPEHPATDAQAAAFRRAIDAARVAGLAVPRNHLANSAATLTRPDLHFEQVRVGLALYGLNPMAAGVTPAAELQPAMTWEADVVAVKTVHPGDHVSYGWTYEAPAVAHTAVVPVGYADGLPRRLQGNVEVTIGQRRYPQVGRVCMDQIVVNVGDNSDGVRPGDTAVLFGPGGAGVDEVADALGTINYEALCLPKGRSQRVYEGGDHA
ncbi:alanine racemase [Corynebacterium uterequi]|uniref:Alanine racemase n=1 Tax=Corynebacterium uterequi TaxID=1072256 RepID=A0A0G3HH03_9CORY|nr:alanine racemase [Corynebacterium uterequi]AKK10432.1 alanine racemase [Corynebacterium uterequi]